MFMNLCLAQETLRNLFQAFGIFTMIGLVVKSLFARDLLWAFDPKALFLCEIITQVWQ